MSTFYSVSANPPTCIPYITKYPFRFFGPIESACFLSPDNPLFTIMQPPGNWAPVSLAHISRRKPHANLGSKVHLRQWWHRMFAFSRTVASWLNPNPTVTLVTPAVPGERNRNKTHDVGSPRVQTRQTPITCIRPQYPPITLTLSSQ